MMRDGFRRLGRVALALALVILVIGAATNLRQPSAISGASHLCLAAHCCADVERYAFLSHGFDVKAVECDAQEKELGDQDEPSGAATLGGWILLLSRRAERARLVAPLASVASHVSTGAPLPRGPPA
jgi:hypothetical protein